MCIITHRPANAEPLSEDIWKECWKRHPDGAGFAYFNEEGRLMADKGFMAFKPLYDEIKKLEEKKVEFVVHFRTASPGMKINPANTHPFTYTSERFKTKDKKPRFHWAVVHNGRLPWNPTQDKSDTACFAEDLLFPILDQNPWAMDNETFNLLQLAVTSERFKNKLVIMRWDSELNTQSTYIINEFEGNRAHGGWFSNRTWEVWDTYTRYHGYMGSESAMSLDRQLFMTPDENGFVWSWKYDCWCNFFDKEWTDFLPYRAKPYDTTRLANKAEAPTGWKRVYVTLPPAKTESAGDKAEKNKSGDKKETQLSLRGPKDLEGVITLNHLTHEEKGMLCKVASKYLKESGFSSGKIRLMSNEEKVDWIRDGVRAIVPEASNLEDINLDIWMLKVIKDGDFDKKLEEGLKATQSSM